MNKEALFVQTIYPSSLEDSPDSFEKIPKKPKRPQRRNRKLPAARWQGDDEIDAQNQGDHRRGGKKPRW